MIRGVLGRFVVLSWAILAEVGASAPNGAWPDSPQYRLAALALLESLNTELLTHESATLTLDAWCSSHHFAAEPKVVAERVTGLIKPATAEQRALLHVGPAEEIRYRRVKLRCGDHILSEADNWYVPSRLTTAMNRSLDTTDIAFGRAVQDLRFERHRLSANLLWQPLPTGWETLSDMRRVDRSQLVIPHYVIEQKAVLVTGDGTPFSEVVESYTSDVLAFPPPPIIGH